MTASSIKEKIFRWKEGDEKAVTKEDIPETLPIIPLRDMVIYPYTVIPILVSEEKSIKAVESAMSSHRIIGAVTSKSKDVESIGPADLYSVGTAAIIHKLLRLPDKGMALIVQGMAKIAINLDDPLKLVYLIATIVKMNLQERQEILEITSVEEKLIRIVTILTREVDLLELGGKIQTQVQGEVSKAQREYYLREQLKAIKQELGETDERAQEANETT